MLLVCAVKNYNATSSLARVGKKSFPLLSKNALAYHNAGFVVVNYEVVGLVPACLVQCRKQGDLMSL
jgi:hypothetical protein